MTDGSAWRPSDGADRWGSSVPPGGPVARPSQSPWWSDALGDPWRDPQAPAAVVIRPPGGAAEPPPAPPTPQVAARRGLGLVFLVSIVTALLAGALGGTLGYVFADRGGAGGHAALGGSGSSPGPAATNRPPGSLAAAVSKVMPSVVTIKVATTGGYVLGSGFVVSSDGYVLTNDHVVDSQKGQITVTFSDASSAGATLVGADPESDVAVLKVDKAGAPAVVFGDSDQLAVGDSVLAIGSPLDLDNTVTFGIISALDRPIEAADAGGPTRYYAAIQTDAAVNHGNSGGPLIDGSGRVIGINSVIKSLASNSDEAGNIGLAFAIPINQAKRIAEDIINSGHARRTVIGAQLSNSYRNPNGGVEVTAVTSGGPAADAGLAAGDVLTRLNGKPLTEPGDLIALVRKYDPGTSVTVVYQRGGSTHTAQVTLAADSK